MKLLPLLSLITSVLSAGVGVHTTIVSRIHAHLPRDIQSEEFLPYLLTGAFFPDAFYTCGSPDTSEAAHWPPFIKAAVEHYHSTYPHTTRRALELKAFIYGVLSHQVADSSWHSIRLHGGLLKMLGHMEFDSDMDRAHEYIDTAGDFLLLNKIKNLEFYDIVWKFPEMHDLVAIFKSIGITISELELRYCTLRGQSALNAELKVAQSGAVMYTEISPLANIILDDYFLGGLHEIGISTTSCLRNLDHWFHRHPSKDPWSLCGAIITPTLNSVTQRTPLLNITRQGTIISPYIPLSNFGYAISTGNFLQEPSLAISSLYEDTLGSVYILPLSEFTTNSETLIPLHITSESSFGVPKKFGAAMLRYTLFGQTFLIVSEPGTGSLYVYAENTLILTIHSLMAKYGGVGPKEQGMAMYAADIDGDGFDEVFVSGAYNDVDEEQRGEVLVISGERLALLLFMQDVSDVMMDDVVVWRMRVPREYEIGGYEQFGTVITADEEMVYITGNGGGVVFCYDFDLILQRVIYKERTEDVEAVKRKSSVSELFGSWMVTGTFDESHYLLVGAPGASYGPVVSGGAVYVYTVDRGEIHFVTKLILKADPLNALSKLGTNGVVYNDVLYIAAPGYHGFGAVFKIGLDQILVEDAAESTPVHQITAQGTSGYSGFGDSLDAYNGYLIVGEPSFGYGEMLDDSKKLTGRLGIYPIL